MLSFNSAFFNKSNLYSQSVQPKVMSEEKLDQDKFAHQRLGHALKENLGVELPPEKSVEKAKSLFDVDTVVNTVMEHIGKRIDQAKSNGASEADLQSMMEAARDGVELGFEQAREQIDSLNKLDEPLAEKIDAAEKGIYDGIDELEENLFSPQAKLLETNTLEYAKSYERTQNSFSFELTTKEGDVVTIQAMSDFESYQSALKAEGDGSELYANYFEQNQSSGFNLLVEGDLNDDEMAAIESLMTQVNDLASEFYTGDLGTAFDMAMNLTSDADQIAQFSLNLKQSYVSATEYGAFQGVGSSSNDRGYEANPLPKGLAEPLAQFAQGVKNAYEEANHFANPRSLLEGLFEQMDQNVKAGQSQIPDLLKPMLDQLAA